MPMPHAMPRLYQVYVLENPSGKRYIGLSEDVTHRLHQHNGGESKWTAKFRPWHLAWTSETMLLTDARKLENRLKRQGRGAGFHAITGLPKPTHPADA